MTIEEKAWHVANILNREHFTPRVFAFDPATLLMLISILTQLGKLLRWWKPEWFVNWQMDRVIKAHLVKSHLGSNPGSSLTVEEIKRAIAKSNQQVPLDQISVL